MQIHSQDEPPFIDQLGFGVAPGFQTFVSCQEQRVRGCSGCWGVEIEFWGTGEMAPRAKCLLCKHEALKWDPNTHVNQSGTQLKPQFWAGGAETDRFLKLAGLRAAPDSVRDPLSKTISRKK